MTTPAARIAAQVVRHVTDLRFVHLADAAEAAAVRILADPQIAAGLRALPVLASLDARHQPREWAASPTGYVCTCGRGAHPCDVRAVLDGELAVSA